MSNLLFLPLLIFPFETVARAERSANCFVGRRY